MGLEEIVVSGGETNAEAIKEEVATSSVIVQHHTRPHYYTRSGKSRIFPLIAVINTADQATFI